MEEFKEKTTRQILIIIYKMMVGIAPLGLVLSIMFFTLQARESKELVANLSHIEQSLSTRHIGIFPDYLDRINQLLAETPDYSGDTAQIIIFQDVLFYGALYNGKAFKKMVQQLAELAPRTRIAIAYYDNVKDWRSGRMFREVVQQAWMYQEDLPRLIQERSRISDSLREESAGRGESALNRLLRADSIASERIFALYRDNTRNDRQNNFQRKQRKILQFNFYDAEANDDLLFKRIDELINACFDRDVREITFYDIFTLYSRLTDEMKAFFDTHNILTIPLNDYLTMSCWSNGEKVLFAFPGKHAAKEIGFISHDRAILDYIVTMFEGVLNNRLQLAE